MRLVLRSAALLACVFCLAGPALAGLPRIAIIIDDLGYQRLAGDRVIALPGPIACAILPNAPGARALAARARASGKEVLLHLPMQAANHSGPTEAGGLTLDMTRTDLVASFDAALRAVPDAIGVNNHRGSLLTRHPGHMLWLMQAIRAQPSLFFIDSYTTHESVALRIANEEGVRAVRRDVFLDSDPSPERVRDEFERLKVLARRQGYAVAIGHPYEVTLSLLEELLPGLQADGFELVPISELVPN